MPLADEQSSSNSKLVLAGVCLLAVVVAVAVGTSGWREKREERKLDRYYSQRRAYLARRLATR